jgi:hypothetical protein
MYLWKGLLGGKLRSIATSGDEFVEGLDESVAEDNLAAMAAEADHSEKKAHARSSQGRVDTNTESDEAHKGRRLKSFPRSLRRSQARMPPSALGNRTREL